ncbi:MAG: response regulator transcription factor [Deltaproteobacteria bacterium]|jgi:DNA-binding NarL/FixJ family response regulator|nr:response regulator transcription factor [Deltaproteobacteria bacterium]
MPIRVLIADDHKIMLAGLRSLLEKQTDFEVVGEAENGRKAVQLAREKKPDVVVMDVSMPDLNGMEATTQIIESIPETKVIALSMHSDKRFVMGMLRAGASGYLLKDCASQELANAIIQVSSNKKYLSPEITGVVIDDFLQGGDAEHADAASSVLSAREREVLQLIAEGWSTKQIAAHLYVSVKTIETHRRQIMKKLDLHTIADLTKYAIREGLTSIE